MSPESSEQSGITPPTSASSLPVLAQPEAHTARGALQPLLFRRRTWSKAGQGAEALLTDARAVLAMPQIDLLLAADLILVLLLVATMDAPPPRLKAAEPALEEPESPEQWTAENDLHAQRILRLENRRTAGSAPLR